jgi:hypothetical protein
MDSIHSQRKMSELEVKNQIGILRMKAITDRIRLAFEHSNAHRFLLLGILSSTVTRRLLMLPCHYSESRFYGL